MNLFERFDQVKIKNTSRINANDQEVCENLQSEFKKVIDFCAKNEHFLTEDAVDSEFFSSQSLLSKNKTILDETKDSFINEVFHHFGSTYKVSLNSFDSRNKHDHTVTWQLLVDEIIEQLGGCSFKEKAAAEVRENFSGTIGRWAKVSIKGQRLTIPDYIRVEDSYKGKEYVCLSYHSTYEYLPKLFKAIMLFERGEVDGSWQSLMNGFDSRNDMLKTDLLCEHDYSWLNKFQSIRFFKNSKVELKFASSEDCEKFAREFCGYTKNEAA